MSKVSFRARALDATKPMPVYKACEIPDMKDFAQINRSVPQMPTGMEKEEETEHHLQRALSARQVYGRSDALVIPIPDVDDIQNRYMELYSSNFKPTKQYIHIQAFNMDQEIPDYDMDSDDEGWLSEQSKKMEMTSLKFEQMMDRLEKGSGQQVVTLQEAKLLLKEDDDLIMAVYDYWLNKRLKLQRPLIATVKSEKRDGTTTNNPYVAFRRRTEKMQTRKNRKNDETSYEKMLKLKRDLQKALTLLELIKRREKSKKEHLQLTIEINDKRFEMEDFSGSALAAAEEERDKHPTFVAPFALNSRGEWVQAGKEESAPARKKRQYRKRKQAQQQQQTQNQSIPHLAVHSFQQQQQQHSGGEVDIMESSDDDMLSPALSQSDHEDENDPDGIFAFKRRKHCYYNQANSSYMGNWPWHGPEEGGRGDKRFRFSLTSLSTGCVGYARRRIGRGGRIIFDRASTEWDDTLERIDLSGQQHPSSSIQSDYITYIRESKIPHYRPKTPPSDDEQSQSPPHHSSDSFGHGHPFPSGFDVEHFQCHREQLLEMQREQQQRLLDEDPNAPAISLDLDHSLSIAGSGSRCTLDSASAEFAVRALVDSPSLETLPALEGTTPATASAGSAAAPVGSRTNAQQYSFSLVSKSVDSSAKLCESHLNSSGGSTVVRTVSHIISGRGAGKTINSLSSGQNSKLDSSRTTKLTTVTGAASLSPSSSVSLLHKSSSAPVIPFITSSSDSSNPLPSTATILFSHPLKTNGPLTSSHIKSSGLSTSPAANILQLNYPTSSATSFLHPSSAATNVIVTPLASSSTAASSSSSSSNSITVSSSPTVVAIAPSSSAAISTLPVTSAATVAALQLQRSLNSSFSSPAGSTGTLYKLPVAASSANFDIIKKALPIGHNSSTCVKP